MTVSNYGIAEYLHSLSVDLTSDRLNALRQLSRQTAMRQEPNHGYFISNVWRGPLLYALVEAYKPDAILELSTGRGYGALSMAMAASDVGLSTSIWTVDNLRPDTKIGWIHDPGSGPLTETISLSEFWKREIPSELTRRITTLSGDTGAIARSWTDRGLPPVDMVFIDADHSYLGVKRDMLSALHACHKNAVFVFDDYGVRDGFGVKRLVDRYIPAHAPDSDISIIELANETQYDIENDHRMAVWIPDGTATSETFESFLNYEQHWLNLAISAQRIAIRLRSKFRMA